MPYIPKTYYCPLPPCPHSSSWNSVCRHVRAVHKDDFREPHTFACCGATLSGVEVMLKHMISHHRTLSNVSVKYDGVFYQQRFSTWGRSCRKLISKGLHSAKENDELDNTPSAKIVHTSVVPQESHEAPTSHEASDICSLPNSLRGLDSLLLLARNDKYVGDVAPHPMSADFGPLLWHG